MHGRGGRHAAIDGFADAAAVAHGPASVLFRVSRVHPGDVALKVFRPGGTLAEQAYARTWMLRDWRIWSELAHPHALAACDYGETNDALFVATPWLDGPSLRAVLDQRRTLDPAQIRELAGQLAGALDAAAAVGLVHLDVKPENVLFSSADGMQRAHVRDFGAGSLAAWKVGADQSRTFRGTLEYAAPEQIGGGGGDRRTTVYSLGCLLYETLTGATPYAGRSRDALVRAHLEELPPTVGPGSADVDRVFATALAKSHSDRYATCTELAEALSAALDFAPAPRPALAPRRRHVVRIRHAAVAGCVAVVATAGVAAASWLPIGAADPAKAPDEALPSRDFVAAVQAAAPTVKAARKSVHPAPTAKRVSKRKPKARTHAPAPRASIDTAAKLKQQRVVRTPAQSGASPRPTGESSAIASPPSAHSTSSPAVPNGGAGSHPATTTRAATPTAAAPPPPPPPPPSDALPPRPPPPPP